MSNGNVASVEFFFAKNQLLEIKTRNEKFLI